MLGGQGMIQRFRYKFIAISTAALLFVILTIVGSICTLTYYQSHQEIERVLTILVNNDGQIPRKGIRTTDNSQPQFSREGLHQYRYFAVLVDNKNQVTEVQDDHIATVTPQDARAMTDRLVRRKVHSGQLLYRGVNYAYKIRNKNGEKVIVFLDESLLMARTRSLMHTGLILGIIVLVLYTIVLTLYSRRAIRPIIEAEQRQKEFITNASHELKTPLTVIQGNADLISETELDEEQRLYAEYISSSSEQMQLYIRTLIDISRAATGYQLYMEDIDLPAYIKQLREQIDALCQTKKIGLQVEIEHLPAVLSVDKLLLERAIMNVVNNALDYSPQNSSISISMMGDNESLKISVTDAGPGFSQEDLLHAEEQFYMADRSRSSNLHFGMGLFITKSIVQQHDGQLILSNSEKTGGAQVTISIPY